PFPAPAGHIPPPPPPPQPECPPVPQTRHATLRLQVHRRQPQRLALQPREIMLDPVLAPITQHRLRQRQPRVVRRVDAPAAQPFPGRDGRLVHPHRHTTLLPHLRRRRTALVLPLRHLDPRRVHLHLDQPHHPVPREDL